MVLTVKQSEQFKMGTLPKGLFMKLLLTMGFEDYLYRYCTIVKDERSDHFNSRNTTFEKFGYSIEVYMLDGKCESITYKLIE